MEKFASSLRLSERRRHYLLFAKNLGGVNSCLQPYETILSHVEMNKRPSGNRNDDVAKQKIYFTEQYLCMCVFSFVHFLALWKTTMWNHDICVVWETKHRGWINVISIIILIVNNISMHYAEVEICHLDRRLTHLAIRWKYKINSKIKPRLSRRYGTHTVRSL